MSSWLNADSRLADQGVSPDSEFGPELTKPKKKYLRRANLEWHVDKAYIRVGGRWQHLSHAIEAAGQMIDFRLTLQRNAKARDLYNQSYRTRASS
jgi:IS6 family transposase